MNRGFSLLETMIAVAVLGIAMAVAVPSLLPTVQRAQLEGSADKVAAFLAHARSEALASRRCVRVYIDGARTLRMEKLNTFDCDDAPTTAPPIAGTAIWLPITSLDLERSTLTLTMPTAPGDAMPGSVANELRFRSTGRLFAAGGTTISTVTPTNDDVVLRVTHSQIHPATQAFKNILVDQNGLICAIARGQSPVATGTDLRCPCSITAPASNACPAT